MPTIMRSERNRACLHRGIAKYRNYTFLPDPIARGIFQSGRQSAIFVSMQEHC